MRKEIKSLHQRIRVTTVYVTHDQTDVMTMVDRIVVMRNGVVEQIAGPLELYDNPANRFVAGFIGSPPMNFIPGVLSGDASQCVFSQSEASVPLDVRLDDGQSGPVIYGIRPEHLRINEQNGRPARVNVVEPMGADTQIYAEIADQEVVILLRERTNVSPGDIIHISPQPGRSHVFAPNSKRRLNQPNGV